MSIRVEKKRNGYIANVTPPNLTKGTQWNSGAPMSGRALVQFLEELGCHQQDIADAFSEADPEWLSHLDQAN